MVTNFDKQTSPLNELELKAATVISACMRNSHVGKDNVVTSTQIISGLAKNKSIKIDGPRLRKIINYLRTDGDCPFIVSTSNGYYVATTIQEVRDCVRSLRERELAIRNVADSMERNLARVNNPAAGMPIKV